MNYYGYEIIRESNLTHHGILGQKWGVRRYQNKDGTLTSAGKKRLAKHEKRLKKTGDDIVRSYEVLRYLQNSYPFEDDATRRKNNEYFRWQYEATVSMLKYYKRSEDIVRSLGGMPVSALEEASYLKTRLRDSPYSKNLNSKR